MSDTSLSYTKFATYFLSHLYTKNHKNRQIFRVKITWNYVMQKMKAGSKVRQGSFYLQRRN